jgi:hypothetical protein
MLNYQVGYRVKHPETMGLSTELGNIGPLWGVFNVRSYGSKVQCFNNNFTKWYLGKLITLSPKLVDYHILPHDRI